MVQEYRCSHCKRSFDRLTPFTPKELKALGLPYRTFGSVCGGRLEKVIFRTQTKPVQLVVSWLCLDCLKKDRDVRKSQVSAFQ